MAGQNISSVSGFPEWLPATRQAELKLLDTIRAKFELYGFSSIETPAVERLEVLDAKGGVGRQIFKVTRPAMEEEHDGLGLGLHFDLTVPLARYVIQHANELTFPFRRYQIQKVWRGERAQRGRFREFYQCDIDVIGRGSLDVLYDAEIPCVINDIFSTLEIGEFTIHLSNRRVLSALFNALGVGELETTLLRVVDRYHKVERDAVLQDLVNEGLSLHQASAILAVVEAQDFDTARAQLREIDADCTGLDELLSVYEGARRLGISEGNLKIDFSIARGLDYYTGTVFETFVSGRESWGSICSGGRYDDLAAYFGGGIGYPGVGISIGLTRLISLLDTENLLDTTRSTPTRVLVSTLARDDLLDTYLGIARDLRENGIEAEVYLGQARLADQLSYASALGIPYAVIAGEREIGSGKAVLRSLKEQSQTEVPFEKLTSVLRKRLSGDMDDTPTT